MTESNLNLLTSRDLEGLKLGCVDIDHDPEIAFEDSSGKLVFTMRGLQLYNAIAEFYKVKPTLAAVSTWEQFLDFQDELLSLSSKYTERRLANELRDGIIPQQERAAALAVIRGNSTAIREAELQLQVCQAAGSNVIPLAR